MARTMTYVAWALALVVGLTGSVVAQSDPFARGWTLDAAASNIHFQSIKNTNKVESSSFAAITGQIAPDGAAQLTVMLDSVDTKIDLRNVRMRFLFFETFNFPEAKISTRVDPALIDDLATKRRKTLTLPFTIELHGVTKTMATDVVVTLLSDDIVSVASAAPLSLAVADFNLMENLGKLQEAAGGIEILPSTAVTFDFVFVRVPETATGASEVAATAPEPEKSMKVAMEDDGDFSLEACVGRFEILSRSGNIEFRSGSAVLDKASLGVLKSVTDIVQRCPGLRLILAGHTDSDGSEAINQSLSEARASSVMAYLTERGIASDRLSAMGYGETRPLVPNTSPANKRRNRRIEFLVAQ